MIYLDSCIVSYAIEDTGKRGDRVRRRFEQAGSQPIAISPLVMQECLVGPLRVDDLALYDLYLRAFEQFEVLELGVSEFVRAAELRARTGLPTPDALHLAAAQLGGCDELWTIRGSPRLPMASPSTWWAGDGRAGAGRDAGHPLGRSPCLVTLLAVGGMVSPWPCAAVANLGN